MRELSEEELNRCKISISQQVHELLIEERNEWLILGDETGGLSEFGGQKNHRPSRMLWVAIPPKTTLPPLHPMYHGQDAEWFEYETHKALQNLNESPEVGCFIFTHEEGLSPGELKSEIKKGVEKKKIVSPFKSKLTQKEHLLMWQFTLPLVLEWVASHSKGIQNVSIYIERVDPLVPGEMPLAPLMQEFVAGLQTRASWSRLKFKEHSILAKNPLEHPWLGYTDALGHLLNEIISERDRNVIDSLREKVIAVPYRQTSLNGTIRQILKSTSNPIVFLKSISDIDSADIDDYIKSFFQGAIREARNSLNSSEWQDLLKHFKNTAENIEGQHATNLILSDVDIDSTLSKLHNTYHKYEFLKSVLGTSNHIGQTDTANQCKVYIDELIDEGLKLSKSEILKLNNLSGGASDNQFDFSHIIDDFDLGEDDVIDWNEETRTYLGAQALSRALRNSGDDLEIAWEIEEKLLSIDQQTDDQFRRRYILRSELLLQRGEFFEAQHALEIDFPTRINKSDNQLHISDKYYLATLLKCYALNVHTEGFKEVCELIELNNHHPSQRIAYWFCRWAQEIAQTDNELFRACINHLLSLKEIQFFQKEAPGVILACELLDLQSRGFIEEDQNSFMDFVLSNSQGYAKEWVRQHPPNAENWLAPLNFNYR